MNKVKEKSRSLFVFFFVLIAFLFVKCKASEKDEVLSTFKESIELTHQKLNIRGQDIGNVVDMLVIDSILITSEMYNDHILRIYNLKQELMIGQSIKRGKGPNEILYPGVLNFYKDDIFSTFDRSSKSLLYFSINDLLSGKSVFYNKEKIEGNALKMYPVNDSLRIGTGIFDNGRFCIYNRDNNIYKAYCTYPKEIKNQEGNNNIINGMLFQGTISIRRDKSSFAFFGGTAANVEICSIHKNEIHEIFSKTYFLPKYKVVYNNPMFLKENRYAFNSVTSNSNYLYALYSGKSRKEDGDQYYTGKNLLIMDWEGSSIVNCCLDRELYRITIDDKNARILGYSINPQTGEPEFVAYKIPKKYR